VAKPPSKQSKEELIREIAVLQVRNETLRKSRLASNIGLGARSFFKYGFIGLFGWLSVRELAGRSTFVNAKLDAAVDMCSSLSDALAELAPHWVVQLLSLVIVAVIFIVNRRLKALNKNLSNRIGVITKKYETLIDEGRSSSNLGEDGQTHERDAL
jgi:hypothetical protein